MSCPKPSIIRLYKIQSKPAFASDPGSIRFQIYRSGSVFVPSLHRNDPFFPSPHAATFALKRRATKMPEAITPSAAQSLGCSVEITKLNPAHSRRCAICRHPDRLFIELEFLEWGHPALIAHEYNLSDRHTVYRHAHAAGLFVRRRRNLVCICEGILEKAERKQITSRDLTFAFNYIERSVRSELAGSATELDRTVTR